MAARKPQRRRKGWPQKRDDSMAVANPTGFATAVAALEPPLQHRAPLVPP